MILTPASQLADGRSVAYHGHTSLTLIRDAASAIKGGEFGQFVHGFLFAAECSMR